MVEDPQVELVLEVEVLILLPHMFESSPPAVEALAPHEMEALRLAMALELCGLSGFVSELELVITVSDCSELPGSDASFAPSDDDHNTLSATKHGIRIRSGYDFM